MERREAATTVGIPFGSSGPDRWAEVTLMLVSGMESEMPKKAKPKTPRIELLITIDFLSRGFAGSLFKESAPISAFIATKVSVPLRSVPTRSVPR